MALITILAPMKMLKISLIAIAVLFILGLSSLAVDRYLYSWTSYLRPFGCEHKSVNVAYGNERLREQYDLIEIGNTLRTDPDYQIESPFDKEQFTEGSLNISRVFGSVKYRVGLGKHISGGEHYFSVRFSNYTYDTKNRNGSRHGESSTTPNHRIEQNMYMMINEMPLNDIQKTELKEKVTITCSPTTRFTF